jgi:5'-deoxynucleotidase YfbR-like HD superfamily hydrolase
MSEMVAGRLSLAEKAQKLFETTSVISTKLSRFEEQNHLESSSITHDAKNIEIPQNSALNLHYVPLKTFANKKTNGDMNASSNLGIIKENTRNTPANTNDIREDVKVPPSIVKEAADGRSKSETSLLISREPSISRKDSAIYKKNIEMRHDPPTNSIGLMSLSNSPAKEISSSNHDQERIVLQNRIQELENLLLGVSKKSPMVITSDIANNFSPDQLKQENQDLKMKVSRKSMELKSLLEQNDSLRAENRRLIESEATMRTKLLDMSLPKSNPAEQLSSNEIISLERLVQKIEEQIGIAVIKTTALKSSFNIKRNQNPVEFIKDILEILLSSTRKLNQPIKNKMLLNLLIEVTEILETVMEQSDQLIKGSFELDGRVQSLGIKSKELTAETDDMINNLKLIHQKKEKDWESKEKKHKKNISMLTERYQEILKENEKLLKTQEEIIQENEELVALARKPQPEPEIVVFENTDEELKKVLRLQKEEELNKLQSHINVLSKTIESWKSENEQLQKHLVELKGKQADSEKGVVQKLNVIADLESKYEDEKLKNQKAAELINSLTEQISKKKESNQIHSEFQHLQSTVDKNTSVKQNAVGKLLSSGDSTNELKILKHVKEIGEKNREITVFTTKLNGKLIIYIRNCCCTQQIEI